MELARKIQRTERNTISNFAMNFGRSPVSRVLNVSKCLTFLKKKRFLFLFYFLATDFDIIHELNTNE